jgi:hypothetical protein
MDGWMDEKGLDYIIFVKLLLFVARRPVKRHGGRRPDMRVRLRVGDTADSSFFLFFGAPDELSILLLLPLTVDSLIRN